MNIKRKDFVDEGTLQKYDEIDGLKVIEEYLLFRGTDNVRASMIISISGLEKMAHITYGLTVNATNKLYVGWHLDKFYKRAGMVTSSGAIKIPKDIFDRVDKLHNEFKNK